MKRTLGTFTPSRNLISISARLLAFGTPEQQRSILMHELAHAIVHHRWKGAAAHGREFKTVCAEIGVEPARFMEVGARTWAERTRLAFKCAECGSQGLRKRRVPMVKCDCGATQRPKRWEVVALDANGERAGVIGTSMK
jgi:predicted SprT family Zn-dependent metalloprotease